MDASQYWPFTCEYFIWKATVTVLQLWMADLEPCTLSNTMEWVYTAFFYRDFTQKMWNLPEETLFSHFGTILNNPLKLSLHRRMKVVRVGVKASTSLPLSAEHWYVYHVSTMEHLSFDPANFGPSPTSPEHHEEYSPQGYRCCSSRGLC